MRAAAAFGHIIHREMRAVQIDDVRLTAVIQQHEAYIGPSNQILSWLYDAVDAHHCDFDEDDVLPLLSGLSWPVIDRLPIYSVMNYICSLYEDSVEPFVNVDYVLGRLTTDI